MGPRAHVIGALLCPVLALLFVESLWRFSGVSDEALYTILFGIIVTGHHMPGWLRAWGEPAVYERHVSAFLTAHPEHAELKARERTLARP